MARRRGQRVARAVDELRANLRIRQVVYVVVQHPQPGWRSGERLWAAGEPAKSRGKAASAHDQPLLVCLRDVSDEAHDAVVFHSAQELVHHVSLKETGAQAALVRLVPLVVQLPSNRAKRPSSTSGVRLTWRREWRGSSCRLLSRGVANCMQLFFLLV